MPMQYPPLADGTYRYGDSPTPLPSPIPGPDADTPELPDAVATQLPDVPPPPETTTHTDESRTRSRDRLAASAIVVAAGLVVIVVLGLSFRGPGSDRPVDSPVFPVPDSGGEFSVEGRFTVVSSPGEPVSGDASGCDLPFTLSDVGEGTAIALSHRDGTRIDVSRLSYADGDLSSCTFVFDFAEVPSGETSYLIELDGRGRLDYSEQELRSGVEITLGR